MLKLLRSGDEGALLQFMKKVKETSFPVLLWEDFVAESCVCGVVSRPHLPSFHDQEMLIYIL